MDFEYDHRYLSLVQLHQEGIRSTKELEEVVEWEQSHCDEDNASFEYPIFMITGLSKKCRGISVVITIDEFGKFVTLDAKVATRDTLFRLFSEK